MTPIAAYIGTDNTIHLVGLADINGNPVNDATVTGALQDIKGNVVSGAGSLTFTYVAASAGNYDGELPATTEMKNQSSYNLFIVAVKDKRFTGLVQLKAQYFPLNVA